MPCLLQNSSANPVIRMLKKVQEMRHKRILQQDADYKRKMTAALVAKESELLRGLRTKSAR